MSRDGRRTTITIDHPSSNTDSITDEEDGSQDSYDQDQSDSQAEEDDWEHQRDDIDPSDSASAAAEFHAHSAKRSHSRGAPTRNPSRQHSIPRQQHRYSYAAPPPAAPAPEHMAAMSSDASDYYDAHGHYPPQSQHSQQYYERRAGAGYPQSHVSGYAPPHGHAPYGGQMVPWQQNPFTPVGQNAAFGYFREGRHEMMPYQQPGFYGGAGPVAAPNYGMPPPHLANMYYNPPPGPPATEVGSRTKTPVAAEEKPNPELEKMRLQLEVLQKERTAQEEAAKQAALERKIREDAEKAFEEKMAAMRLAQEEAKKEIELARIEAERAMRERIEEERKAELERQRQHEEMKLKAEREARERLEKERQEREKAERERADAMAKAEREAKEKYEAALKEAELRQKKEAEERELLEAQTRAKIEAENKAAEEARKAAEKKAEEDAARKKLIEEEARQAAIAEMKKKEEDDKKAAEEAATKEAADRLKYETEARLKLEAEKKAAADDAAKEDQRKKDEEELKKKLLEQAKVEADEAAKKAASGEKEPIRFKDAVGRKYSFPFHLASEWRTMEGLINQAFAHIDNIAHMDNVGSHVRAGHYDLEGPEGELILKEIWSTTIQPGWQITMKMWPLENHPLPQAGQQHIRLPPGVPPEHREAWLRAYQMRQRMAQEQAAAHRHHAAGGGGGGGHPQAHRVPPQVRVPPNGQPMPPPGAHYPVFGQPGGEGRGGIPAGVDIINGGRPGREPRKNSGRNRTMLGFFAGKPSKSSSKKKSTKQNGK